VCDVNHFKKIKINPLLFVKDKLIYLHKIPTQSLSKRINNKALQEITLIEGLNQVCVCQGEYGQPYSSWLSYVVW
jgi:hypothetical protein